MITPPHLLDPYGKDKKVGKYSEYDRASLSLGWRILAWLVAALVIGGLITWAVLGIRAITSETKGALDKEIAINQGKNQIQSQELFQDLYAKIQEYDSGIDVLAAAVRRNPSSFNQTNLDGQILACIGAVKQYNSEAGKISRGKWMSPDLPFEIDQTDPRFDCKETQR